MNGHEKSDSPIVPRKSSNKADNNAAEAMEGRGSAKGNTDEADTLRTQKRDSVPSGLERVREAARSNRELRFTTLLHHVTTELLRRVFYAMQRRASPGIDGVTWRDYEENLKGNLLGLLDRVHRGAYQARPSKRVYIPKPDGRQRPLGIASVEDKLLQGAILVVLNSIFEVDFADFSYGFRPERGAHDALDALTSALYLKKVNWVLDADIQGFFDALDHETLMGFLERRIGDKRILRLIRKWLKAGVLEGGRLVASEEGSPQGATISPLLANIYMHYAFDLWAHQWRRQQAHGDVILVRYADDFVVGFERREDAERFLSDLRDRLAEVKLTLHPDKTRLFEFGRFAAERRKARGEGKPETFVFLGFTHICGRTKKGTFQILRRTYSKRMRAKLKAVRVELLRRRHLPPAVAGQWLRSVLKGYFNYFAVGTNLARLRQLRTQVARAWFHALTRRSQRHCFLWARMRRLVDEWLPIPILVHPPPLVRFAARTRGKSPVR